MTTGIYYDLPISSEEKISISGAFTLTLYNPQRNWKEKTSKLHFFFVFDKPVTYGYLQYFIRRNDGVLDHDMIASWARCHPDDTYIHLAGVREVCRKIIYKSKKSGDLSFSLRVNYGVSQKELFRCIRLITPPFTSKDIELFDIYHGGNIDLLHQEKALYFEAP